MKLPLETFVTRRSPFQGTCPRRSLKIKVLPMPQVGSIATRVFIAGMATIGCACLIFAAAHWQSGDPVKFACYLIAALLAASLKVSLPGIEGTLSVNFLFTLLGILELSLPETLLIGIASTLAQFYWRPKGKVKLV